MEPLSVGLLLASLASSVAGGASNRHAETQDYLSQLDVERQQMEQRAEEARARNDVFNRYRDRNDAARDRTDTYRNQHDAYTADNQTALHDTIATYAPGAQEAQRGAAETGRVAGVNANVAAGNYAGGPPQGGVFDSPTVKAAYDEAINRRVNFARQGGVDAAKVSSYGDSWDRNADANKIGAGKIAENKTRIDTNNAVAANNEAGRRDSLNMMKDAQDLAGFQTQRIINRPAPADRSVGQLLSGLGNFGASVAGSGRLGGPSWGSLFNSQPETPQRYLRVSGGPV